MDIEELQRKDKLRALLDGTLAFIGSPTHLAFVESVKETLSIADDRILNDPVTTPNEYLELRAQRRLLLGNLSLFEDAAETLKDRLEAIASAENPNSAQLETDDENEQME